METLPEWGEVIIHGRAGDMMGYSMQVFSQSFTKLIPLSSRPYGRLYAY